MWQHAMGVDVANDHVGEGRCKSSAAANRWIDDPHLLREAVEIDDVCAGNSKHVLDCLLELFPRHLLIFELLPPADMKQLGVGRRQGRRTVQQRCNDVGVQDIGEAEDCKGSP